MVNLEKSSKCLEVSSAFKMTPCTVRNAVGFSSDLRNFPVPLMDNPIRKNFPTSKAFLKVLDDGKKPKIFSVIPDG